MQIIILLEVSCKNIHNKVKKLTTIGKLCPLTQKKIFEVKKKIPHWSRTDRQSHTCGNTNWER